MDEKQCMNKKKERIEEDKVCVMLTMPCLKVSSMERLKLYPITVDLLVNLNF